MRNRSRVIENDVAFSHRAETSLAPILALSKLLPISYSSTRNSRGHRPSSSSAQLLSSSLLRIISSTSPGLAWKTSARISLAVCSSRALPPTCPASRTCTARRLHGHLMRTPQGWSATRAPWGASWPPCAASPWGRPRSRTPGRRS